MMPSTLTQPLLDSAEAPLVVSQGPFAGLEAPSTPTHRVTAAVRLQAVVRGARVRRAIARWSRPLQDQLLDALLRCPPRLEVAISILWGAARRSGILNAALADVGAFMDGVFAYVLSTVWHDLLTRYLFRLSPAPFCGAGFACVPEAGLLAKCSYAAGTLLVAAFVNHQLETSIEQLVGLRAMEVVATVPVMTAMCAGWGLALVFLQILTDLGDWLCSPPPPSLAALGAPADCNVRNGALATALTLGVAVLIGVLQPYASGARVVDCGGGCGLGVVARLERWLGAVWRIVAAALKTVVFKVWYTVSEAWLATGLEASRGGGGGGGGGDGGDDGGAKLRMQLLWATTLTFSCSKLVASLEVSAEHLRGEQRATVMAPVWSEWRRSQLQARLQLNTLVQEGLGWLAGCAWTEVLSALLPELGFAPSWWVCALNLAAALALTLGALAFILFVDADNSVSKAQVVLSDRKQVEHHFLISAMSFFAGWGWIVAARDAFVPIGNLPMTDSEWVLRASVLAFATTLTAGFVGAKHRAKLAFHRASRVHAQGNWSGAVLALTYTLGDEGREWTRLRSWLQRQRLLTIVGALSRRNRGVAPPRA